MPEWVIYKNDQKIGQAITWHKALDILIKQESLTDYNVNHANRNLLFISCKSRIVGQQINEFFKIIKER